MNIQTENKNTRVYQHGFFSRIMALFMPVRNDELPLINNNSEELLLECIKNAKIEWEDATRELDYVDESDTVDYCIYKIKAHQIKYENLLRKAKKKGLKVE